MIPWHRRRGTWTALAVGLALLAVFHFWAFIEMLGHRAGVSFNARSLIAAGVFMLAATMVWAHRPPPSPRVWALPPEYGGYPAIPREYREQMPPAPAPPAPMPPAAPRAGDYGHLDDLFGGR